MKKISFLQAYFFDYKNIVIFQIEFRGEGVNRLYNTSIYFKDGLRRGYYD